MKLFTKKNQNNNDGNAYSVNIEQQLNKNIFKHKNGFEAQKSKLYARINQNSIKKDA